MTISRADAAARLRERRLRERNEEAAARRLEFVLLAAVSILLAAGLALVFQAKLRLLGDARPLDLNTGPSYQVLLPYLRFLQDADDQEFAARELARAARRGNDLPNVGALGQLRLTQQDLAGHRGLDTFPKRLAQARAVREERETRRREGMNWLARAWEKLRPAPPERAVSIPLLTGGQLAQLKPQFAVRTVAQFRGAFLLWAGLFLAAFFALHFFWRVRGFGGDNTILPAVMLLSGIGFMLMVSMRDPIRDTLTFVDFAQGVVAGCIAMGLFSIPDYERRLGRLSYVPLLAALLLALALGLFGTGPGVSDAKVNLFFFQPIELIRILLVMFLAGYFAQNWDALRELRQRHGWAERFNVPRLDYALPVLAGVAAALLLFFWLSDLGPALVVGCLFLALYAIARNRALLAAAGLAVIVLGFWAGHAIGKPETAAQRVDMWLSPWDNHVRGGDQIADGLWALSTGGVTGSGPGLGSPAVVPAAHTDLVLAAAGEELGFLGLTLIYLVYGFLVYRSLRIALGAPGAYSFFLAAGLTLITALQILLISGGMLWTSSRSVAWSLPS